MRLGLQETISRRCHVTLCLSHLLLSGQTAYKGLSAQPSETDITSRSKAQTGANWQREISRGDGAKPAGGVELRFQLCRYVFTKLRSIKTPSVYSFLYEPGYLFLWNSGGLPFFRDSSDECNQFGKCTKRIRCYRQAQSLKGDRSASARLSEKSP